jgi:hypothetical protein
LFHVSVHRGNAGEAELCVTITDSSGQKVPFDVDLNEHGETLSYVPQHGGIYMVNVTFGGICIPGNFLVLLLRSSNFCSNF